MKTAISIPDRVFRSAEQLASRLGMSRSELYSRALAELLEKYRDDLVTSRLNAVYGNDTDDTVLDPELARIQYRTLVRNNP